MDSPPVGERDDGDPVDPGGVEQGIVADRQIERGDQRGRHEVGVPLYPEHHQPGAARAPRATSTRAPSRDTSSETTVGVRRQAGHAVGGGVRADREQLAGRPGRDGPGVAQRVERGRDETASPVDDRRLLPGADDAHAGIAEQHDRVTVTRHDRSAGGPDDAPPS